MTHWQEKGSGGHRFTNHGFTEKAYNDTRLVLRDSPYGLSTAPPIWSAALSPAVYASGALGAYPVASGLVLLVVLILGFGLGRLSHRLPGFFSIGTGFSCSSRIGSTTD